MHCLGVSSLLFDELARSSSRLLLALCTFCLYIVIIRMPMSFLRVHLCLIINVFVCIMYQSMRVCTYIYLTNNNQMRLNRCGLAMCPIKQKLLPGSHQVSSCHHTPTPSPLLASKKCYSNSVARHITKELVISPKRIILYVSL